MRSRLTELDELRPRDHPVLPRRRLPTRPYVHGVTMGVNVRHPSRIDVGGATECCGRYERSSIASVSGAADARAARIAASS